MRGTERRPAVRRRPLGAGDLLGGANPTHTGQALALRTAERLAERYFGVTDSLAETEAPADD